MENASKALIMAGSILLAILIISLSIYTFKKFSASAKPDFTEAEVREFNSKILPYCGENVSGSKVNALLQNVRVLNVENNNDDKPTIEVIFPNGHLKRDGSFSNDGSTNAKGVTTGTFYQVKITGYGNVGYISAIEVTQ